MSTGTLSYNYAGVEEEEELSQEPRCLSCGGSLKWNSRHPKEEYNNDGYVP